MSGCCGSPEGETIRETVREAYAQIAVGCGSCCGASAPEALARGVGYSDKELAALPEGANMGLSCGNPTALAELKPGEVVLDLGAGGGFDVFIAAGRVGEEGRVIGVDMTAEMVSRARAGAERFRERTGLANVEFRLGEIEHLPVADAGVDAVISNCVINLSPDKPQVWREIERVLRPGGRAAVSDMALLKPLPEEIREDAAAISGCVGGAATVSETEEMVRAAGLTDVVLTPKGENIDAMIDISDPFYRSIVEKLPAGEKLSDYVTSLYISARKPE